MRRTSRPCLSFSSSGSQLSPQMTLITFQPAPRKMPSSSWMILPLPRTGPSSRCKLQLMTKIRLSQLFAAGQRDGPQRFGLVGFAVAQEGPDVRPLASLDAPIVQILIEPGLVDGHDRGQAHRDGRKFPELGHQPGMRIARQPAAGRHLAAEVFQMLLVQAAFEKRPGVNARRSVPLEINLVAANSRFPLPRKKWLKATSYSVAAEAKVEMWPPMPRLVLVRPHDHRHGVPADDALDPPFHLAIAGVTGLLGIGNAVDVGSVGRERQLDAVAVGRFTQLLQQERDPLRALGFRSTHAQRIEPFGRFHRIGIGLGGGTVYQHWPWANSLVKLGNVHRRPSRTAGACRRNRNGALVLRRPPSADDLP